MIWLVTIVILLGIGSYYLFRDTMNRIQYIETIRLYWITRDADPGGPHIKKAWMRHTSPPYWRGEGIEFRAGKYTFQVGILQKKMPSLEHQLSEMPDFDPSVKEIKEWVDEST